MSTCASSAFGPWRVKDAAGEDGQELRFAFRRTRAQHLRLDPEEALVDRVAGTLTFHPAIFVPVLRDVVATSGG
jgi:hypothetical protein